MTVGRFANSQALAKSLIQKNGEAAEIFRTTRVAGSESWRPVATDTKLADVDAVFLEIKTERSPGVSVHRRRTIGKVLIAGTDVPDIDPTLDYLRRTDGSSWEITDVELVGPNEDKILWKLVVQR